MAAGIVFAPAAAEAGHDTILYFYDSPTITANAVPTMSTGQTRQLGVSCQLFRYSDHNLTRVLVSTTCIQNRTTWANDASVTSISPNSNSLRPTMTTLRPAQNTFVRVSTCVSHLGNTFCGTSPDRRFNINLNPSQLTASSGPAAGYDAVENGANVRLQGSCLLAGVTVPCTMTWTLSNNAAGRIIGGGLTPSFDPAAGFVGNVNVTVRATYNPGFGSTASATSVARQIRVSANAGRITISAGGPYANLINGTARTLRGSCSYPGAATCLASAYRWERSQTSATAGFSTFSTGSLSANFSPTVAGSYWFRLRGCVGTGTTQRCRTSTGVRVLVVAAPPPAITCPGGRCTVQAGLTFVMQANTSGSTFRFHRWTQPSPVGGTIVTNLTANAGTRISPYTFSALGFQGRSSRTVTVDSYSAGFGAGVRSSASQLVTITAAPPPTITCPNGCRVAIGDTLPLTGVSSNSQYSRHEWTWSNGANVTINTGLNAPGAAFRSVANFLTPEFPRAGTRVVTLNACTGPPSAPLRSCVSQTRTVTIVLPPYEVVLNAGVDVAQDEGSTIPLRATCTNGANPCVSQQWNADGVPGFERNGLNASVECRDGPNDSRTATFRACDIYDRCSTDNVVATCRNVRPTFTTTPPTRAVITQTYVYQARASDPANTPGPGNTRDPQIWTLTQAPAGMTVNGSGRVTYVPGGFLERMEPVTLSVSDGDGGVRTQSWNLNVEFPPFAVTVNAGPDRTLNEGTAIVLSGQCSGCDPNRRSWDLAPPADFEVPTVDTTFIARDGPEDSRTVTFRGCDVYNRCTTDAAVITVRNVAPTITTTPARTAVIESPYTYNPAATDPANSARNIGDPFVWSLINPPTGMTVNRQTGAIAWTPGGIRARTETVILRLFDGNDTVEQRWNINVRLPPLLITTNAGAPTVTVPEGGTVPLTDARCNEPQPGASSACSATRWDYDGDGTTDNSTLNPTYIAPDGDSTPTLTLTSCDRFLRCITATRRVVITNVAPRITSTPPTTGVAGTTLSYQVVATDPANSARGINDPFVWTPLSPPSPADFMINTTSGRVTWRLPPGTFNVGVRVDDGDGGQDEQRWTMTIPLPQPMAVVTPRVQPERADFTFQVPHESVNMDYTVFRRVAGNCTGEVLFTGQGRNRLAIQGSWYGLSPGGEYCATFVSSTSQGLRETIQRVFTIPAQPTFTAGPATTQTGLDIGVNATMSVAASAAVVEYNEGNCDQSPTGVRLDGSDIINVPGLVVPGFSFSLEGWINTTTPNQNRLLMSVGNNNALALRLNAGRLELRVVNGGAPIVITSPNALPVNQYTHIMATFNGGPPVPRVRLYVGGQNVGSRSIPGGEIVLTGNGSQLGGLNNSGFIGEIASWATYNREVTTNEAARHFTAGVGVELPLEIGLVSAWRFAEASGVQSVYDASGNHWTATLGETHLPEASDPGRTPLFAGSQALTTGTNLTGTITGLTGGPNYCYRVVSTTPGGVIASPTAVFTRARDEDGPTFDSVPPLTVVECVVNESAPVTLVPPMASDNFDPNPRVAALVNGVQIPLTFNFPLGTTRVTWRATDNAGNATDAFQDVRVRDRSAPTAVGGAELVVEATSAAGTPVAVTTATPPTDTCSPVTLTSNAPATFPLGPTLVDLTARDTSGNTTRTTRLVRIVDTTPPTINVATLTVGHDESACFAFVAPTPAVADNGYPSARITVNGRRLTGPGLAENCWNLGTHTVEWTATDPAGNTRTSVQTIIVRDATLEITFTGLEVGGRGVQPGAFYNAPVTVILTVAGGVAPYNVTLNPAPTSITQGASASQYRALYTQPGSYERLLSSATDSAPTGAAFGSAELPASFGIDLTAPTVEVPFLDQTGVVIGDISTYPYVFEGETLFKLDQILARDAAVELTALVAGLTFDGGDVATAPTPRAAYSATAAGMTGLTVEAWARYAQPVAEMVLVSKDGPTDGFALSILANGRPQMAIRTGGVMRRARGAALNPGRWHHIVGTYSATDNRVRLWVDGAPWGQNTTAGNGELGNGDLVLGAAMSGGTPRNQYTGDLADVAVHNVAISEDLILTHYRGGVGAVVVPTANTVAAFRMRGATQVLTDTSANGFNGQLGRTVNAETTDPTRLALTEPGDATASGLIRLRASVVDPAGTRSPSQMLIQDTTAVGTPLRVGTRSYAGLSCNGGIGGVCIPGESILRPAQVATWNTGHGAYILEVVATDSAGNITTRQLGFRTGNYRTSLGIAIAETQRLNTPAFGGPSIALGDALRQFRLANQYERLAARYTEGSRLQADNGSQSMLDAISDGIFEIGLAPEYVARAMLGEVRGYIGGLAVDARVPTDVQMRDDGLLFVLDGRFRSATGNYGLTVALTRQAQDATALLYPAYAEMRRLQRLVTATWNEELDLFANAQLDADQLRTSQTRVFQIQNLMAQTRNVLRDSVYLEIDAALTVASTAERAPLQLMLDVLDKEDASPAEAADLIAVTDLAVPAACMDVLARLQLDDQQFTRCYLRLNTLAGNLDGVSEALVATYRWRAALATALFNMLELTVNVSPTGLGWVTSDVEAPALQLVLPDTRLPMVAGSVPISSVDNFGDRLLTRVYDRHAVAQGNLQVGDVNGAWAIFLQERCLLLWTFNRYYSTGRTQVNFADPKEDLLTPADFGCSAGLGQ